MAITRESVLAKLDLDDKPSNSDRRERLFKLTGAWPEGRGKAAKNYQAVGPVTERIQNMGLDLSHLRRPISVEIE